jgi:hypothetical protein
MLDYVKTILQKVSFDSHLFERELKKSINDLINEDIVELKRWCYDNFGDCHSQILNQCFV